jgi:hypothetical protein
VAAAFAFSEAALFMKWRLFQHSPVERSSLKRPKGKARSVYPKGLVFREILNEFELMGRLFSRVPKLPEP